jgi:hypothetical protein
MSTLQAYLERDAQGIKGLDSAERWARSEFVGSLAYFTVLLTVLLVDRPPGVST